MAVTDFRAGADTSSADLYWVEESAWGVLPAGPPTLNTARIRSETLSLAKTTQDSDEIESGRQVSQRILTEFSVPGTIGWALSLDAPAGGHLIDFFEGAFLDTWSTAVATGAISCDVVTTDTFQSTGNPFAGIVVGQWIKTSGFTDAANNGTFRVSAKADDNNLTVNAVLVNETGDADETIDSSQMIRNGTTAHSYSFELNNTGVTTNPFLSWNGIMLNTMTAEFSTGNFAQGTFGVLGKTMNAPVAATVGDGTPVARSTSDIVDNVTKIGTIELDSTAPVALLNNISWSLTNNMREQRGLGAGAPLAGIGLGNADLTGSLTAYWDDDSQIANFINHTPVRLNWIMTNTAGAQLIWTVMAAVYNGTLGLDHSGPNQDVNLQFPWVAQKESTTGKTFQLDYVA